MKLEPEDDFPELQRDPKSKIWYVRKEAKGKRPLFKSTRERHSKSRAKLIALRLLSDWLGAPVRGRVYTWRDIGLEVVDLKKTKAKATYDSAANHINKRLMPFFGHYRVDQVNEATFDDYVSFRMEENPKQKLFNDWKHFLMVMNRAFHRRLIPHKISVKNPDPKVTPKRVYTDFEEAMLLSFSRPILQLQILLGIKMGMRPGEVTQLKVDRIDFEKGFIRLKAEDTKTRRPRDIPFHSEAIGPLKEHLKEVTGKAVFATPDDPDTSIHRDGNRRAWDRSVEKAGLTGGLHSLRHTCATRMAEAGMHPVMAARILGMSVQEYDRTYCKPREKALAEAMNQFAKKGSEKN